MEINFNEGKKELNENTEIESHEEMISEDGEIITDYEEDTTDYQAKKSVYNKDEFKDQLKKIIKVVGIIIIVLIVFILIISLFTKKNYTYDDVEKVMENACKDYFKDYANYLPKEENDTRNVPVNNLIEGKYMKDLSYYLPDSTCTGRVTVEKLSSDYDYRAYLNCGDSYETIELYKRITKEDNLVTSGYGLYSLYGNYVFRGEDVNNYIEFANDTWRVVKVTSDGNVVLIYDGRISSTSTSWDDRYNQVKEYNIGINNFATSRVKENLAKLYNNKFDEELKLFSETDKAKLTQFDLCVGKRSQKDTTNNNSIECSEKAVSQDIGLLTVSEYMQASLDTNCKTTVSENCQNYNYLNTEDFVWWLATADKGNTYDAYYFEPTYGVQVKHASSSGYLRPVVYLKSNVFYKSGNGSKEKPYKIK